MRTRLCMAQPGQTLFADDTERILPLFRGRVRFFHYCFRQRFLQNLSEMVFFEQGLTRHCLRRERMKMKRR